MEIIEVGACQYDEVVKTPYHIFGTAVFNQLNANKVDEVYYLLFKEGKYRLGIIGGKKDDSFQSPFSAPYGGFVPVSVDIRIQYIQEALRLLINWSVCKGLNALKLTLPPAFYDNGFIAKQINCFWRGGFEFSGIELNYSCDMLKFGQSYTEEIWRNAKKNLRISIEAGLKLKHCLSIDEKELAYDIIARNRQYRGRPLHMTLTEVFNTIDLISADFFTVNSSYDTPIAAALVFHVTKDIVQVIYWGDLPGYSELKPMNYLSYKLFEFYKLNGKSYIDLGHSTENSIPNYGLCEFKESIGCEANPRYSFIRYLK